MIVGFKAKNHPQQTGGGVSDETDDRRTPASVFAPQHALHDFTVDAASSVDNHLLPRFWTLEDNGLLQDWRGERLWINPPFSDLRPWVRRAHLAVLCPLIVMLLPANRTEQRWWHEFIEPYRDGKALAPGGGRLTTEFYPRRIKFGYPPGHTFKKGNRPPFGCVICTWRRGP